jgi:hypothetical protein
MVELATISFSPRAGVRIVVRLRLVPHQAILKGTS